MSRTRTIRKKLFISYTNLIVSVIIAFAILIFVYISHILTAQTLDMMTSLLTAGNNQMDMEVRKMDTVSLNISYSELVKGNFESLIHQETKIHAYDERARMIIDALIAINGPLMPVQQMNLYSFDERVLSTGYLSRTVQTQLPYEKWYQRIIALDGKKDIVALEDGKNAYIYKGTDGKFQYIALNRLLFNKYGQQIGILEVITKNAQIFQSINEIEEEYKENISAYVFDEDGQMIYPYSADEQPLIAYEILANYKEIKPSGFFRSRLKEQKYNIYYNQSDYTGWTFVLARSQKSVITPILTLAVFMMIITSVFIGIALLSAFLIAKEFSNPIKDLLLTIRNTRLKNLEDVSSQKVTIQITELGELDKAFRDMRVDLKHSTEAMLEAQRQELKARMLALQSQMNPHFLYNTLANISVMAEEGLNEGIVDMCEHVSFLLRYFSASKPGFVTLKEEFECAQKFLGVAQIRYKDYLRYNIEMDEEVANMDIPRNIVQPLVENAVKYGMNEDMVWHIKVEGYIENGGWRIKVSDLGNGFSEEKINALQEKINVINAFKEYVDLEINGMGFINVFSRLKLTYKENMFFEFGNSEAGGAVIIIGVKNSLSHFNTRLREDKKHV